MDERPGKVSAIGIMTIVSGVINVLWGLIVTFTGVVATLGIGLICAPLTILPTVLGIFEIIYGIRVLANPPQPLRPSTIIAIFEIVAVITGNVISAAVGIAALILYNDDEVKLYFASINP